MAAWHGATPSSVQLRRPHPPAASAGAQHIRVDDAELDGPRLQRGSQVLLEELPPVRPGLGDGQDVPASGGRARHGQLGCASAGVGAGGRRAAELARGRQPRPSLHASKSVHARRCMARRRHKAHCRVAGSSPAAPAQRLDMLCARSAHATTQGAPHQGRPASLLPGNQVAPSATRQAVRCKCYAHRPHLLPPHHYPARMSAVQ